MNVPSPILKANLWLPLVAGLLVSGCVSTPDGETTVRPTESAMQVRTTIQNTWTKGAAATVDKNYNGAWGLHEVTAGGSIVARLYRHDFLIGTIDGAVAHEIAFQIPADVHPGQEIALTPVPGGRPARKEGESYRLAPMKDGEITAFQFCNPLMGWMKRSKIAKVTILSIREKEVVIRLRLKADLVEVGDFDMDEQFTLKVTPLKPKSR